MIYIIENHDEVVAVLEGPNDLDLVGLFEDYKRSWSEGLEYSVDHYNHLLTTEGYKFARSYLQAWRDKFDKKIENLGTPLDGFIKSLDLRRHAWKDVILEDND